MRGRAPPLALWPRFALSPLFALSPRFALSPLFALTPRSALSLAVALSLGIAGGAAAQTPPPQSPPPYSTVRLNYVYAANLGFGGYAIGGLTADVFSLPLATTFDVGDDGWKLRVKAPIQLGIYSFQGSFLGTKLSVNQQSLGVIPGLELQVPVGERVTLKPFVDLGGIHGFGTTGGAANSWVYTVGVRAVTRFQVGDDWTLLIGNGALFAGDSGGGFTENYTSIQNGIGIRRPLGISFNGFEPDVGVYTAWSCSPKPLEFSRFLDPPLRVSNQGEIGVTLGSALPFEVLGTRNPRIGAGYVFGEGLTVWHVSFGFPF